MATASGLPSIFLADLNSPNKMYVLGGWPSQDAHQKGFEGSEEQEQLIEGIKDVMEISWMEYFDVEIRKLAGMGMEGACLVGVVVGCGDRGRGSSEENRDGDGDGTTSRVVEDACRRVMGRDDVLTARNLKKEKEEREEDYVVMFAAAAGLEEGNELGERIRREMESMGKGVSVKVCCMRRIDVEGNGRV